MKPFVIVIDDSPTVCKIIEFCLCREGYEVKSFSDGIQAIRWLTSPQARIPALVFIDRGLPKLDGIDVMRGLKARPVFEQTIFVMISGRDGLLDRIKGRLAGANIYLTKPLR